MKPRKQLISWLFDITQKVYTRLFKNHKPWGISRTDLLAYPNDSFGKHLGIFLDANGFELIPKVERHDCYHVLTGYSTKVEDEIALQYLCFANGKRSPYLIDVIALGTIILPDYLNYYIKSFKIGRNANPFHQFDYSKLLTVSIDEFRLAIFSKTHIQTIDNNI